jgi:hypothetical protein
MAKNEKPGHRTSADFAGSGHLDRHPREVHGQPWEAGNWHIGRRQELAVDVRPTLLAVEQYAEYLQSEAKEINRRVGLKAYMEPGPHGIFCKGASLSDFIWQTFWHFIWHIFWHSI